MVENPQETPKFIKHKIQNLYVLLCSIRINCKPTMAQRHKNALMRLHHLWPQKSQNRTIPVNLEAIRTTMIASKLFRVLYLGYYRVLHYIVYGLQLRNFDISSAFTFNRHPWTCPLSSNISSRSQTTCDRRNPVQKQPHTTSGLNCSMFLMFHRSPRMV